MADRKAQWHARALENENLSPKARAYHEQQLRNLSGSAPAAASSKPSATPKPPRAAKKAAATPPAGAQHAAQPSEVDAYIAAHAHLHQGPEPAAPSAKPRPPVEHTPEQMRTLAEFHEHHARAFEARGDTRGAAVHAQKAADMRQALAAHPAGSSTPSVKPTGRAARVVNPVAEKHRVEGKRYGSLAAEARKNAAAEGAKVAEHLDLAAKAGDETQSAAHKAQAAVHRSNAARYRAEAATHTANAADSYANAAEAESNGDEKAKHVATAARQRAQAATFNAQAAQHRSNTATHQAQNPQGSSGHGRDPLKERRERIEQAAKSFRELIHTGSHDLIRHMQREVGH